MKKNIGKSTRFEKLRRLAEERLRDKAGDVSNQARDDAQKLGFYLIRVGEAKTDVHFIRTYGETRAVENPGTRSPRTIHPVVN